MDGWKLLIASGYRLRPSVILKLAALPLALTKFVVGKRRIGEEDTLCAVARKVGVAVEVKSGAFAG
jgi:hypothetical protein